MEIVVEIIDVAAGRPAAGVAVWFEQARDNSDPATREAHTDSDGRALYADASPSTEYKILVASDAYFAELGTPTCYPLIGVCLRTGEMESNSRVGLLLAPYGYQVQVSRERREDPA